MKKGSNLSNIRLYFLLGAMNMIFIYGAAASFSVFMTSPSGNGIYAVFFLSSITGFIATWCYIFYVSTKG